MFKLFLGYAPGVGKTYNMLSEAIRRHTRGEDVAIGVVETHGRKATADLMADLETVPRKKLEYKGAVFEEMDVDAILARKPQVVLVDELAHTNIEGSKHRKRYEDVFELLDAGIAHADQGELRGSKECVGRHQEQDEKHPQQHVGNHGRLILTFQREMAGPRH